MEWLKTILLGAELVDGVLEIDGLVEQIGNEMEEQFVLREKFEELEIEIQSLSDQLQREKDERFSDKKQFELRACLARAGAIDVDYLVYQIGDEVAFDQEGDVIEVEELIQSLKDRFRHLFLSPKISGVTPFEGDKGAEEISKQKFEQMSYSERSALFHTAPELYQRLQD